MNIVGLNQKYSSSEVNYACILSPEDEIVMPDKADLNSFLIPQPPLSSAYADRFTIQECYETEQPIICGITKKSCHSSIHKNYQNYPTIIAGIDEPTFYESAYSIPLNSGSFANITIQAPNNPIAPPLNTHDFDDFKVVLPQSGKLRISAYDIPVNEFACYVLNTSYQVLTQIGSNGADRIDFEINLSAGTYFIEFEGIPTPNSWRYPYVFFNEFTPTSNLVANFTADDKIGCAPFTTHFSNQSTGGPTAYQWSFPGGSPSTSTQANPTVTYLQTGIYNVSLTISKNGSTATKTENGFIAVGKTPTPNFTFNNLGNNNIQFINTTTNTLLATNYIWTFGDFFTSTEVSPTHQYLSPGTYNVKLTAVNSCGNSVITKPVATQVSGTSELAENQSFEVFPNPNDGSFQIVLNASSKNSEGFLLVTDAIGREILREKLQPEIQVDLPKEIKGIFFVGVANEQGKAFKRVVVE